MNEHNSISALQASVVGILNSLSVKKRGHTLTGNERSEVRLYIDQLMESNDPTDWEFVRNEYLYDEYLKVRQDAGTLTPFDLVRPGLSSIQFANESEFYEHKIRESKTKLYEEKIEEFGTKVCTACNQELPLSKFKKRGGGKCNACRCRMYRDNKAKKEDSTVV